MNILVLSDSHRKHAAIRKLLSLYENKIDAAVHLGDHADDLLRYEGEFPGIAMHAVAGNCDYPNFGDADKVLRFEGRKILLTHGHRQEVKNDFNFLRLKYYAEEKGADACLFGHTHKQMVFDEGPIFFMNPGSVGRPNPGDTPGYGLLRVSGSGVISGTLMSVK